jgi:repressor LexA
MGEELTNRQRDVLAFITEHYATHGAPPTISEIGDGLGIKSKSTTHAHVLILVDKGQLSARKLRGSMAYFPVGTGSFPS